jgi:hypothetical protein
LKNWKNRGLMSKDTFVLSLSPVSDLPSHMDASFTGSKNPQFQSYFCLSLQRGLNLTHMNPIDVFSFRKIRFNVLASRPVLFKWILFRTVWQHAFPIFPFRLYEQPILISRVTVLKSSINNFVDPVSAFCLLPHTFTSPLTLSICSLFFS